MAVLFGFFLFLFGIIGVNLFSGKLHYRCAEIGQDTWIDDGLVCQLPEPAVGDPPPAPSQGNCDPGQLCTYYTTEQIFAVNPALGALSYDNCLYAFVTIFQAVSLEGWVDQMYMLGVTTDPTTATIYYIAVVVLGAMFIVNLFLAVMFEAFIDGAEEEDAEDGDKPAPKQDIVRARVAQLTRLGRMHKPAGRVARPSWPRLGRSMPPLAPPLPPPPPPPPRPPCASHPSRRSCSLLAARSHGEHARRSRVGRQSGSI